MDAQPQACSHNAIVSGLWGSPQVGKFGGKEELATLLCCQIPVPPPSAQPGRGWAMLPLPTQPGWSWATPASLWTARLVLYYVCFPLVQMNWGQTLPPSPCRARLGRSHVLYPPQGWLRARSFPLSPAGVDRGQVAPQPPPHDWMGPSHAYPRCQIRTTSHIQPVDGPSTAQGKKLSTTGLK